MACSTPANFSAAGGSIGAWRLLSFLWQEKKLEVRDYPRAERVRF
jgi:hypothetical protein